MRRRRVPDAAARHGGPHSGEAGFTLLECLVALTVAAILSVGLVRFMASTHVVAGHADRKLAVAALETAVLAALPPADELVAFRKSGSRGELDWEMTGVPVAGDDRERAAPPADDGQQADSGASPQAGAADAEAEPAHDWRRYTITISVRAHGALVDQVEMIRIGATGKPEGAAAP